MTKLKIDIRNYFKFDRIVKISSYEWFSAIQSSSKLTEEMLELLEELAQPPQRMLIIEEAYDVFNCALSVYLGITKYKNIEEACNMMVTEYNTGLEFTTLDLIHITRMNNSYQHIGTYYQSKSGIATEEQYIALLKTIIGKSLNTIMWYLNQELQDDVEALFHKKLDKWESKLFPTA